MSDPRRPSLFDLPLDRPDDGADEDPSRSGSPVRSSSSPSRPSRPSRPSPPGARGDTDPTDDSDDSDDSDDARLPLFPPTDDVPEAVTDPREGSRASASPPPSPPSTRAPQPERHEVTWEEQPQQEHAPPTNPPRGAPVSASLASRFLAGGVDLGLHVALGLLLLAGATLLGARLGGVENLGILSFLVVFSFLYITIPLAFWGQTPGMMRAEIVAASGEEGALTFGQTALRWLGSLLSLTLLGLPALLAAFGGRRSFTDWMSGSRCWRA